MLRLKMKKLVKPSTLLRCRPMSLNDEKTFKFQFKPNNDGVKFRVENRKFDRISEYLHLHRLPRCKFV